MEIRFKAEITETKCTLYVGLQKRQCQQQDMMQLISQASPNIVPAAMLPIARP
jgi:hypothetical protein